MKLTRKQLNILIESLLLEDENKEEKKSLRQKAKDFKKAGGVKGARQRRSDKIAAKVAADMYGDDFAAIEKEEAAAKKAEEEAEFQRERQKSLEAYDEETAEAQAQKEYSEEETKKTFDELKTKALEYRQDTKSLFNESKYYAKYIDTLIRECYFRKNVDYSLLKLLNEADQPFNPLQDPDTIQRKRFELGADRKSAEGQIQTKQAVGKDAAEKSKKAVEKAKEVGQGFINLYKDTKEATGSDSVNYIEEAVIFYSNILRDMADEMTGLSDYDESTIVYVQSLYATIFNLELEFEKVLKLFTDKASPEDSNKYSMKLVKEKIDDAILYYENEYTGEEFQAAVDKIKAEKEKAKEEADASAAKKNHKLNFAKNVIKDKQLRKLKGKAPFMRDEMNIVSLLPYPSGSIGGYRNILNLTKDQYKEVSRYDQAVYVGTRTYSTLTKFLSGETSVLRAQTKQKGGFRVKGGNVPDSQSDLRIDYNTLILSTQKCDFYFAKSNKALVIDGPAMFNIVIFGFEETADGIMYTGDDLEDIDVNDTLNKK